MTSKISEVFKHSVRQVNVHVYRRPDTSCRCAHVLAGSCPPQTRSPSTWSRSSSLSQFIPTWFSDTMLEGRLRRMQSIKDWHSVVSSQQSSTWNQAIMCLSALGDMVSKAESKVAHSEAPDRATLCSAVESLTGVVQKTQPKQNTTRTADVGLLGAGLMTSSQLMDSQYGNRDMRKGLQQKAQQLQDVLISQSHEYLASQLPDSPGKDASQGALDQSASSLLVGLAPVRDQKCRIELLLANTISSHPVSHMPSMTPDTAAMALITVLDPATSKSCASQEFMKLLRTQNLWHGFGGWLEGPVRGCGMLAIIGLLCRLVSLKMTRPAFVKILAEETLTHVDTAKPELISQAAALLIPMQQSPESEEAVEKLFSAIQARARDHWSSQQLVDAVSGANGTVKKYGESLRVGALSIAQIMDDVACGRIESIEAQEAYSLVAEMEEARFTKHRLMGLFVRQQTLETAGGGDDLDQQRVSG